MSLGNSVRTAVETSKFREWLRTEERTSLEQARQTGNFPYEQFFQGQFRNKFTQSLKDKFALGNFIRSQRQSLDPQSNTETVCVQKETRNQTATNSLVR